MLKDKFKKLYELFVMLKLVPKRTYTIASVAVTACIITAIAEYVFAMLLQVYLHFLGFVSTDKITTFLKPLTNNIFLAFGILICVIFIKGFSFFIQTYINIAFAETFVFETRKRLLFSLFRPNSRWNYDLGTTSNIMGEVIPKAAAFMSSFAQFLTLSIQAACLGILCIISLPKESLMSLLLFGVMSPFVIYLNKKTRRYGEKILERSQKMNSQLMKSVKNFVFIKILGIEEMERDKTLTFAKDYYNQYMHNIRYYSMANAVPQTFGIIVVVLLFYFFNIGGTSKASLLTMFYLLYCFIQTLGSAVSLTNGLSIYFPNFKSIIEIIRRDQEENSQKDDTELPAIEKITLANLPDNLTLEVKDLSFSYNTMQTENFVFDKVSLALHSGELFVVKGRSGSGKSTLLMNLIGVLRPTRGYVKWAGIDLSNLAMSNFKQAVGYMGPEPYIISGSIYHNLSYGLHREQTKQELMQACKLAEVDEFLSQLPNGLDTILTEQGEGLSMGQKQRLGLARALLRQPKILVLDEITANLDQATEKAVITNVRELKSDRIILVATHSSAFDGIADVILDFSSYSYS